jgi:TonB family protein
MLGPALRRARVRERPRLRALAALLASIALNALFAWLLARAGAFAPPRPVASAPVALAPISPDAWSANRSVRPEPRPPSPRGRVIELPPEQPGSGRPPEDARFLSDRDARVERETVSRDAGRYGRLASRAEPGARQRPPARAAGRSPPADDGARSRRGRGRGVEAGGLALAPSPEREDPSGDRARGSREAAPAPGAAAGERRAAPDLRPTAESLARIAGGPNMDGYGEAEEGDETALSAREFRFATFLNQMRNEIGEHWYPSVAEAIRERDPEGKEVFYRERTVVLHLTLGPSGDLRGLTIAESSRVDFVDAVAVASVRRAQPFANPPRALFGPDGEARVPFAFTVYPFDRRPAVRWRQPVGP